MSSSPANAVPAPKPAERGTDIVTVQDLTMAFGSNVVQHDLNFGVRSGEILVIMGGSGCGNASRVTIRIGARICDAARSKVS